MSVCLMEGSAMTGSVGRDGWTIHEWVDWVQGFLDEQWLTAWEAQLPRLTRIWEREGEAAYGLYSRRLFVPVRDELARAGLRCRPALPGTFQLSEERWGYLSCRERRLWSVLEESGGKPTGAIVTRFFHDHTRLRVPKVPIVFAVEAQDVRFVRRLAVAGTGPMR
jgi:hypothetical protein